MRRILKEAARLFRERGFDGAGVAEIMKAAGLTHGAFYAHFSSKEALEAEAVERAFAQSDNRIYALTTNTRDRKRAFLDSYLSAAHRDHPGSGCVIAALAPEIARNSAARSTLHTAGEAHDRGDGRAVSMETRTRRAPQLDPSPVGCRWGVDFGASRGRPPTFRRDTGERSRQPLFVMRAGRASTFRDNSIAIA